MNDLTLISLMLYETKPSSKVYLIISRLKEKKKKVTDGFSDWNHDKEWKF
jgi:hypothetical protein